MNRLSEVLAGYCRRLRPARPSEREVDGSAAASPSGEAAGGSAEQRRRRFWSEFREGQQEAEERARGRS